MKNPTLRTLAFAVGSLLCGAAPAAPATAAASLPVHIRLVGLNDFHGNLEPARLSLTLRDPQAPDKGIKVSAGGAAALGGLVTQLRVGAPHTIFFSSGDLIGAAPLVSTLFRHEPTIEVMNRLGLDFSVLGNHELDAGRTELLRLGHGGCTTDKPTAAATSCSAHRYAGAKFPWLAANVTREDGATLVPADVIRTVGGVRIGFIGAVTRSTPSIVLRSGIAGLDFGDEADAINQRVAAMRKRGVEAIVAVLHEGGELPREGDLPAEWNNPACPGANGNIFDIAKRIAPQVDAIFSAHTHQGYACMVDGRPVIQATSYGRGVAVVDVVINPRTRDIDRSKTRAINLPVFNSQSDPDARRRLTAAMPPDLARAEQAARDEPAVQAIVSQYAALAAPRANREIGRLDGAFTRAGADKGDSPLGRLIADAHLAATRATTTGAAQIAFTNAGGLRADLDCQRGNCPLTYGQAFTAQPFGNTLVTMSLTGAQLKALLESQQRPGDDAPRFLQPSASLTYTWRNAAPQGEHVDELRLEGKSIAPDAKLRITVNNFLAEGGDDYPALRDGHDRIGGPVDIEALIDYARAKSPLRPEDKPRIRWVP